MLNGQDRTGHRRFARHRPRHRARTGQAGRHGDRHGDHRRRCRQKSPLIWPRPASRAGALLDVTDAAPRRGARRDREGVRRDHDSGQQRRHHPRQSADAHEGRRVGCGHRYQSEGGVPPVTRRHARHDEGALRPHHQYHLGGRLFGQSRAGQLLRGQGRRRRHEPLAGPGTGQPQHHGQLRRARLHRHRHDARLDRRAAGGHAGVPFRSVAPARRTMSPLPWLSGLARLPPTSPARPCMSMAACTWIDFARSLGFW